MSSLLSLLTTPMDGLPFDPLEFEAQYMKQEKMPDLHLSQKQTKDKLVDNIQKISGKHASLLKRDWTSVSQESREGNASSIRIMQWNMLAQALCTGRDNFVRCPTAALQWESRRLAILQEILTVNPDVLCLQEVDHFRFVMDVLQTVGYEGSFLPKPDSPALYTDENNGPDGCAIFYNSNRLELLKIHNVLLDADGVYSNQVSIIYHLQCKISKNEILVGTTHLKAKPGWETLRNKQGISLLNHLTMKAGKKPLIVCGDFNAESTEPVYKAFSDSSLNIASAYKLLSEKSDKEPPYTTLKIRGQQDGKETKVCRSIDYVWYSRDSLEIRSLLKFPTEVEIGEAGLPSFHYPSDHLSLAVDVVWKEA